MFRKINIIFSLIIFWVFSIYPFNYIHAYNIWWTNYCFPTWDGDWILDTNLDWLNCTYPSGWYKIYWNVEVWKNWDFTITIPNWVTMGIDLSVNKIEFKDSSWNIRWKIKLNWTAVIKDVNNGKRYYISKRYYANGITKCPRWTVVLWSNRSGVITKGRMQSVPSQWYMYCARIWPNSSKYNCYYQNGAIVCERK